MLFDYGIKLLTIKLSLENKQASSLEQLVAVARKRLENRTKVRSKNSNEFSRRANYRREFSSTASYRSKIRAAGFEIE